MSVCKACGEEPLPVLMNTDAFTLSEYLTDRENAEELGICLRCYWGRKSGVKKE